ncbi:DAK2 domain-containing protein [Acetobacterium sp.]|jgi:dihydroxyacetone kinase-like protein|uniref:DAK2 domain-containing protein n=1 Tax=Acetobacterium sp. TaxID=1872094 RepID=UPI000CC3E6AC|nr:DAK2 domain-containing protein [Acetobacterium sp.]MDO9492260.1 DAK2 domain-containing protein [Acetobacterium sp.]PKM75281.1 MAG: dihydroxyacetone kinase subunit L [Firmicutes bacterium HGW-Firmicutes-17]
MPIKPLKIKSLFLAAAREIADHVDILTDLDCALGDGDHGTTMKKLTKVMTAEIETWNDTTNLKAGLKSLNDALEDVSGGSAGPLFGAFIYGMAEAADPDAPSTDAFIKSILLGAYDEFFATSKAVVGDKSMMDAIFPATEVIRSSTDDMKTTLENAAQAARTGSDNTAGMLAKFGRARYIGDRCLGHKDPGSVTFAYFYEGLAKGYLA